MRKWIRPDLQLKLVLVTMLVAISVLLINYQTCLMTLWSLEGASGSAGTMLMKSFLSLLWQSALIAIAVTVPLSVIVGTFYSFRLCGPSYALEKFSERRAASRWDVLFCLREGDDL